MSAAATAIDVEVLALGPLSDLVDGTVIRISLPAGASVADLLGRMAAANPALAARLPSTAVAVNLEYVGRDTILRAGDRVALIPPVSGG